MPNTNPKYLVLLLLTLVFFSCKKEEMQQTFPDGTCMLRSIGNNEFIFSDSGRVEEIVLTNYNPPHRHQFYYDNNQVSYIILTADTTLQKTQLFYNSIGELEMSITYNDSSGVWLPTEDTLRYTVDSIGRIIGLVSYNSFYHPDSNRTLTSKTEIKIEFDDTGNIKVKRRFINHLYTSCSMDLTDGFLYYYNDSPNPFQFLSSLPAYIIYHFISPLHNVYGNKQLQSYTSGGSWNCGNSGHSGTNYECDYQYNKHGYPILIDCFIGTTNYHYTCQ